jgi:hypothetical protein
MAATSQAACDPGPSPGNQARPGCCHRIRITVDADELQVRTGLERKRRAPPPTVASTTIPVGTEASSITSRCMTGSWKPHVPRRPCGAGPLPSWPRPDLLRASRRSSAVGLSPRSARWKRADGGFLRRPGGSQQARPGLCNVCNGTPSPRYRIRRGTPRKGRLATALTLVPARGVPDLDAAEHSITTTSRSRPAYARWFRRSAPGPGRRE